MGKNGITHFQKIAVVLWKLIILLFTFLNIDLIGLFVYQEKYKNENNFYRASQGIRVYGKSESIFMVLQC